MLNVKPVTISTILHKVLPSAVECQQPIMLWSQPGLGKSQSVEQFCRATGRDLRIWMAAQMGPAEIALPYINTSEKGISLDNIPSSRIPTDDRPCILFLDELTNAQPDVVVQFYQLLLDRRVGETRLGDNVYVMAAGNRPEDNTGAIGMNPAIADRVEHYVLRVDSEEWLEWGSFAGLHPAVLAFIKREPGTLVASAEDIATGRVIVPTPRSWERVSKILYQTEKNSDRSEIRECRIPGQVGDQAYELFVAVLAELEDMPTIDEMLDTKNDSELRALIPSSPSKLYGICFALANHVTVHVSTKDGVARAIAAYNLLRKLREIGADVHPGMPWQDCYGMTFKLLLTRMQELGLLRDVHKSSIGAVIGEECRTFQKQIIGSAFYS